jgi:GT2 family glycosyltransferase
MLQTTSEPALDESERKSMSSEGSGPIEELVRAGSEQSAKSILSAAMQDFGEGRVVQAYAGFVRALHLDPENSQVLYCLSEACIRLDAAELAIKYSRAALAKEPRHAAALAVQIEASVRQNDLERARALLGEHPETGENAFMHRLLTLRLALAEEEFEVALSDLAELVEKANNGILARELFETGFKKFLECDQANRLGDLVDALGLRFPEQGSAERHAVWSEPADATIDVIIPVHNALRDLADCLESLRQWAEPALRKIILVDDASDRVTRAWLDRHVAKNPDTVLVRNPENLGFTRSAIAGIAQSNAPFFVLLNSDTITSPGWMTGLWRGLAADDSHAMVGPLSNNARFQSIAPASSTGGHAGSRQARSIDRRAAFVRANGLATYPKVPLLSGFCLLIRRDHYDAVGGLDAESYPCGYWEVQDLALRMIDRGLYPCLADDVYVHHSQSASIETEHRNALLAKGFQQICGQHGTIRVLFAEEICRNLPEVQRQREAADAFFQTSQPTQEPAKPVLNTPAFRWLKAPQAGMISPGAEVCLFVAHAPYGQLPEFTAHYLKELQGSGLRVVVCLAVNDLTASVDKAWSAHADAILLRENCGFDFGAWADLLRLLPEIWTVQRLLFANDSVIGPFAPLDALLARIREANAGFFALTDCAITQYHVQSFFFGWAGRNLSSAALQAFWASVENIPDKEDVIQRYEIPLLGLCDLLPDSDYQVLFGIHDLFGPLAGMLPPLSAAHHAWQAMIKKGMPFIKTEVLRHGRASIDEVCALTGANKAMVLHHLEQTKINRL